jgi:hypothetical protein
LWCIPGLLPYAHVLILFTPRIDARERMLTLPDVVQNATCPGASPIACVSGCRSGRSRLVIHDVARVPLFSTRVSAADALIRDKPGREVLVDADSCDQGQRPDMGIEAGVAELRDTISCSPSHASSGKVGRRQWGTQ